jgi:hypothetical protein
MERPKANRMSAGCADCRTANCHKKNMVNAEQGEYRAAKGLLTCFAARLGLLAGRKELVKCVGEVAT